jgi:hypothetical protein
MMDKEERRRIKRAVKLAVFTGGTLPFSLEKLISAGIGLDRIRKVYRKEQDR